MEATLHSCFLAAPPAGGPWRLGRLPMDDPAWPAADRPGRPPCWSLAAGQGTLLRHDAWWSALLRAAVGVPWICLAIRSVLLAREEGAMPAMAAPTPTGSAAGQNPSASFPLRPRSTMPRTVPRTNKVRALRADQGPPLGMTTPVETGGRSRSARNP